MDTMLTRNDPVIFHFRVDRRTGNLIDPKEMATIRKSEHLSATGGVTMVFNPRKRVFGYSVCNVTDHYNFHLGRSVAEGRSNAMTQQEYECAHSGDETPISHGRRRVWSVPYTGSVSIQAVRAEAWKLAQNLYAAHAAYSNQV